MPRKTWLAWSVGVIGLGLLIAPAGCRQAESPTSVALEEVGRDDAVKLAVVADDLYQVSVAQLRAAGMVLDGLDPDRLALSLDGESIPYTLVDGDLVFYGRAPDSRYAPYRAYLLESGRQGQLMPTVQATPAGVTQSVVVTQTLHLERNLVYDGRDQGGQDDPEAVDPWYWANLMPGGQTVVEVTPERELVGQALLEIGLIGVTHDPRVEPDHTLLIKANDQSVGLTAWDGLGPYVAGFSLPAGLLKAGANRLLFENAIGEAAIDISRLDWMRLTFQAEAVAVDDYLAFASEGSPVVLSGFSGRPTVVNVTNPDSPALLVGSETGTGEMALAPASSATIVAAGPQGFGQVAEVVALRQSRLADPGNRADLIVITTENLAPALQPLVTQRRAEGLDVVLATTEEIYDNFGFGQPVPESLHRFVIYATTQWTPPRTTYLLLAGDTSHDYRGYLGPGLVNPVPAPMVPVVFGGETSSDARLADVDGDLKPDLAVGRFPVDDSEALAELVRRTLDYSIQSPSPHALFAVDGSESRFAVMSETLIGASMPADEDVIRLYGSDSAALLAAWREGAWLINYAGHGSIERWGKEGIFSTTAVDSIDSPAAPPLVVQLTCLTGYIAHPSLVSLSEKMLLHPKGPVGVFAASSLTLSSDQLPFGEGLLAALVDPQIARLGDALLQAKQGLDIDASEGLREVSDTFGLLGDPTLPINRPPLGQPRVRPISP